MARILIHVHVYYVKSWYKIEKCLKKIMADKSNEVKILTTASADIDDSDIYKIERTRVPNMSLIRVPNDGYDIQPFFLLLKEAPLRAVHLFLPYRFKISKQRIPAGQLGDRPYLSAYRTVVDQNVGVL